MPDAPRRPARQRATALSYTPGDVAPRIAASGSGVVAARIIEVAREAGVPVREDPALAEALAALDLGTAVPAEMWKAVAEALAWAYRLDAQARRAG
jgi:flagellar biosynthesis protein